MYTEFVVSASLSVCDQWGPAMVRGINHLARACGVSMFRLQTPGHILRPCDIDTATWAHR